MLVLSRQRDETIMIGDEVQITIVDIRGDKVRLGITAPARIAVHRKEVYDAITRENEQAAAAGARLEHEDLNQMTRAVRPGPARARPRSTAAGPHTIPRGIMATACPDRPLPALRPVRRSA